MHAITLSWRLLLSIEGLFVLVSNGKGTKELERLVDFDDDAGDH